jgi:arsenite methyltransferase
MQTAGEIRQAVQHRYGEIARGSVRGCCGQTVELPTIGYSQEDLALAGDANLGLGCGNPLALAEIEPGMTVLDLGSGAGFDAFLALERVGPSGRVIGVDMTDDMLSLARQNAERRGSSNVEFRKGYIEAMPVEDSSVDMVISNCVINLSADKAAVFREIHRVLKPGGRFAVSDIVLLRPLPPRIANDVAAYVGCVAGASLLSDYLAFALEAGLTDVSIPQITNGSSLLCTLDPDGCCGTGAIDEAETASATAAIASVKLHGRKS